MAEIIDRVMALPEKEDELFWDEMQTIEEEKKMPYVTSVERIGYKRGYREAQESAKNAIKEVRNEGKKEGQASLLARQIAKKYKSKVSKESPLLKKLEPEDLVTLGEKLFDFETLDDVHDWIEKRLNRKTETSV